MTCFERFLKFVGSAWSKVFLGRSMQMDISNTDILAAIAQVKEEQYRAPIFLPPQK